MKKARDRSAEMRQVLVEARKRQGLSQEDLADLVNVRGTTISRWERGIRAPSKESAAKLAAALHLVREEVVGYAVYQRLDDEDRRALEVFTEAQVKQNGESERRAGRERRRRPRRA